MRFPFLTLSWKSLMNRRVSVALTVLSLALSVMLFAGVEKIRKGAEESFEATVSGTDLIVGARTGQLNLLLYTVFRIGEGTQGISWESYELVSQRRDVAWTIPISLGDSHKGYRVMGTNDAYFEHFKYGRKQPLILAEGRAFQDKLDVVVGAEVAETLGYSLGDKIRIAHGLVATSFAEHDEADFKVVGILAPTGTPVDATVHVTLEGLDHVHEDGDAVDDDHDHSHEPEQITAFFVGTKSPPLALGLQRAINTYEGEPLTAILPGVTLSQLWSMLDIAERTLILISAFVVAIGLLSMLVRLLASLGERRREMAILRAVGARPGHLTTLLVSEAAISSFFGAVLGLLLLYGAMALIGSGIIDLGSLPAVDAIVSQRPGLFDLAIVSVVTLFGAVLGIIPAWKAGRDSLADGLTVKV